MGLLKNLLVKKERTGSIPIGYVIELVALNLDCNLKQVMNLCPLSLPLHGDPEVEIDLKVEREGMAIAWNVSVAYGKKVYKTEVPPFLFNYIAHLIGEYEELKFKTVEDIDAEVQRKQIKQNLEDMLNAEI